ncbi:MAG TPA: cation diffusion facilitator family transporter [Drouetiella sp.]
MDECCESKGKELSQLRVRHKRVLLAVLAINLLMFAVELVSGLLSHSTSLLADSLDMLGDALVYIFSIFVIEKSSTWQARASLAKGLVMLVFGLLVLVEASAKLSSGTIPEAPTMTGIGLLALAMNGACFFLLWSHRGDNLNMRSTWICSRNDVIANAGVIAAGVLTFSVHSNWPDIVIGSVIALIFLRSAWDVVAESRRALKANHRISQ